jgi:tRNA pseudouridine55 synthase
MTHAIAAQKNSHRSIKRNISGVLLLDKPYGLSSNKALQIAKRHYSAAKSGHTGTLDPMATGLLAICFGEATKFSSVLLSADKTYEAVLKLGYMSTTGDAEGEIEKLTPREGVEDLTVLQCERVLKGFIGKIMQTPPMYSALKHQGKPLYSYARNGEVVKRQAREVSIHKIQVNALQESELQITVTCGTGTYIRTLAEDIGRALGFGGAYLVKLCRSAIDRFDLSQAQSLNALEDMAPIVRDRFLLPVDCFLYAYPALTLDKMAALHLIQGRVVCIDTQNIPISKTVRLFNQQQQFMGLGEVTGEQNIIAKRLLANSNFETNS